MLIRSSFLAPVISVFFLSIAGCSFQQPKPQFQLAPVRGVVTLNGRPLPRAFVLFESFEGRPSSGLTDDQGRYELSFDYNQPGANPGGHLVKITRHYNPMTEQRPKELPGRYNTKSDLIVRVQPGDNVFDFDLTDDVAPTSEGPAEPTSTEVELSVPAAERLQQAP